MSDHAVFLVHGLWGNKAHFWYLESQLQEKYPSLKVHACAFNEGNRTYDGIDVGGERIVAEIEETLATWKDEGTVIRKLSIVGYSLGGLICRYAVGLLFAKGFFEEIKPINFTTFATPHLGARHINPGVLHTVVNFVGPRLLSESGRQMFISDHTPRPLLLRMTDRESVFMRGLALFVNRTAYANVVNDRSVPYHTAAMTQFDPYVDMSRLNLCYVPSYAPIILHPTHPIIPLSTPKRSTNKSWIMGRFFLTLAIILLLPIWACFFVLANLYQQYYSAQRIREHFQHHHENHEALDYTTLNEVVQEAFEDVVDNAALFSTALEEPGENEYTLDYHVAEEMPLLNGNAATAAVNGQRMSGGKPVSVNKEEYKLHLSDEQVSMMIGLRSIAWRTFGVHINETRHSHAAIIRRSKWRRALVEGNIVIQHWLDGQFQA